MNEHRQEDEVPYEVVRAWAEANGNTYDALEDGRVPERVLSTLREGKSLRDLYDEAYGRERMARPGEVRAPTDAGSTSQRPTAL